MPRKKSIRKQGIKNISLGLHKGTFNALFHIFSSEDYSEEVTQVRALLSNERAKMIHVIKQNKPSSIYVLAKILKRNFQAVRKDISLLQHFGIIKLEKKGVKRISLKPIVALDSLQINIKL